MCISTVRARAGCAVCMALCASQAGLLQSSLLIASVSKVRDFAVLPYVAPLFLSGLTRG